MSPEPQPSTPVAPPTPDAAELARFSAEAGRILGASLDFEATLRRVADLAVPRISDWCAIELLAEDGRLEELALAHTDPAKMAIVDEIRRASRGAERREGGSYEVVRTGEPVVVAEITPELIDATAEDARQAALLKELELRSYMCVPLRTEGRVIGTLTLATDGSGRHFGAADLATAEDLAGRASSAIANARAYRTADRFRRILDTVAEAVFVIDPGDGRIREVNRGAVALLGRPAGDIVDRRIWEFTLGLGQEAARELIRPLLDGQLESRTVSTVVLDDTGRDGDRPVDVILQRVDLLGEEVGLVAIARDVRERVESQARLERLAEAERARAAELDAVIRAMADGVIVCAADGRVTLANPAAQTLLPDLDDATYEGILAHVHDPDGLAPRLGVPGGPVALPTLAEPTRWIEISASPVQVDGDDEMPPETIIVLRDVTAARERESLRETFVGVLSHELRTPVTTIYGGAKVLARPGSNLDEATRAAIFADIADEAERLQRLVEDVVALNRFGEAGGDVGQEPVLLQRIVPGVLRSEEGRWPSVGFTTRIPAGLPTVVADPTYVEQVLRNLVSNAAKYAGEGASVEVIVEPGDGEVAVRVLDDGPGIDEAEAERLFELFYRSAMTAGTTAGAGIGLFVCARLVAAMGGRIWARPRPTGGSEFGFSLRVMGDQ